MSETPNRWASVDIAEAVVDAAMAAWEEVPAFAAPEGELPRLEFDMALRAALTAGLAEAVLRHAVSQIPVIGIIYGEGNLVAIGRYHYPVTVPELLHSLGVTLVAALPAEAVG